MIKKTKINILLLLLISFGICLLISKYGTFALGEYKTIKFNDSSMYSAIT